MQLHIQSLSSVYIDLTSDLIHNFPCALTTTFSAARLETLSTGSPTVSVVSDSASISLYHISTTLLDFNYTYPFFPSSQCCSQRTVNVVIIKRVDIIVPVI